MKRILSLIQKKGRSTLLFTTPCVYREWTDSQPVLSHGLSNDKMAPHVSLNKLKGKHKEFYLV